MVIFILLRSAILLVFFFSSRRRHTRSLRDWSSDVCSSDLPAPPRGGAALPSPPAVAARRDAARRAAPSARSPPGRSRSPATRRCPSTTARSFRFLRRLVRLGAGQMHLVEPIGDQR